MVFDTIMELVKNDELLGAMEEFDAQARSVRANRADIMLSRKSLRGAK